ncbi:MAG: hypothetical protein HY329_27665 [Chloroflexi bacterium]|nr:hypothetical protein [Chloroflexota bacterium]
MPFRLPGRATAVRVQGNVASARIGDLEVRWTSDGGRVKEDLELRRRPTGDRIVFELATDGLTFVPDAVGGYSAQIAGGEKMYYLLALTVQDSRGRDGAATLHLSATSTEIGLDPSFLSTADYPISVDPTIVGLP